MESNTKEAEVRPSPPKVEVRKYVVPLDPPIYIFHVEIFNDEGTWSETWGSQHHLDIFLRGVRAALGVIGVYIPDPEIPENVEQLPEGVPVPAFPTAKDG